MERSRVVLWVLVLIAAGGIIWWVGFHAPSLDLAGIDQKAVAQPGRRAAGPNEPNFNNAVKPFDPNAPQTTPASADANKPAGGDANQPAPAQAKPGGADANAPSGSAQPGQAKPAEAKAKIPEDPNDPLEAVNLKDVEMKNIIEKIAQWTGKTVIPADEAMKQKITIYAPDKLPRSKALMQIYSALRMKGYSPEEVDGTIFLKPLSEARLGIHPVIRADQPLAAFENPNQIVQKPFNLTYYPPAQMGEIIRPLMGEYAHVAADETTGTLLVIDTVANLLRVEKIIAQFDVPDAGNKMITEIFEIHSGDPTEMVQLLRLLLGGSADSRRGGQLRSGSRPRPASQSSGGKGGSGATFVVIGAGETPIYLIPEAKRKVIIARGSADSIRQIGEWIGKLDQEQQITAEYETVSLVYADADEVARRIQQSLEQMPGTELRPNVLVQPLAQSRQVMIFGRADLREMIKRLIAEVDIMPGERLTEVFELAHADPDQIKANIEGLYETEAGSMSSYSYRSYRYRNVQVSETVKVVSYPTMQRVTVIASPENMEKIRAQIKEWDVPLDVEQVKPRIIELQNSDPVKMAQLLSKLFTEESDSSSSLFRMLWYGYDDASQKKKIVGPLYGQLTFEEVPGTKKIIVISKIPQAYDVIEQIIYDLDRQKMAEIPRVVQLKYADPEDLSERLNAMFNEPGTLAPIRRSPRGLGDYSMEQRSGSGGGQSGNQPRNDGGNNPAGNPGEYTPWWSRGARRTLDEEPLSNVVGRVRFIPDPRSKSILVLSPPEFHGDIEKTIRELDVPGMQVMIKATVVEVNHSALTSLGIQLATDPEAFGTLEENAITALTGLTSLATHGSAAPASTPLGAQGTGSIVGGTTNIYALIDFLIKHVNAKIMNEQTLWTKDNEEASFFKGSNVAFQRGFSVSDTGGRVTSNFEFEDIGMTLAVRPSITPEKNVDMIVNILLSQLTGEFVNGQPVRTKMDTRTNMIVADSETLMLGGILFQEKTRIKRKLPLLGDLPLIGGLFQHNSEAMSNNEMIVFITPYVVSDGMQVSDEAQAELDRSQENLQKTREELGAAAEALRQEMEEE